MTHSSICTRSIAAVVALSFAALTVSSVTAQTTATTVPVGFITKTVPGTGDPANPGTATISVPLYATADFTSAVLSVDSATQFTMSSAVWTAGQFTSTPHLVRVKTGVSVGQFFLISAHTANQLTVLLPASVPSLVGVLSVNDSCEILPANTLASVFGATATGLVTGGSAGVADNVFIWNGTGWDTFYNNGTNWRKPSNLGNFNNVVIYPDDGLYVTHRGAAAVNLTLMGTVPATTELTELQSGTTFIANRFPVDTTLNAVGIQSTANFTTGGSAGVADNVFHWNGAGWDTFYHNGTNWRKPSNLGNFNTTPIATGDALYILRRSASASVLSQALPYTP